MTRTSSTDTAPSRAAPAAGSCCGPVQAGALEGDAVDRLADDLQLLAHPVRLQILDILARRGGDVCVCHLVEALPVKQPTISHHLRLLREAGLVEDERKGLWAYYRIVPGRLRSLRGALSGLLTDMEDACCAPDR